MRIAVIADDLTGANDTGVQFARYGLSTSVLLEYDPTSISELDTIVIDTDSRSLTALVAYNRVKKAAEFVKGSSFEIIYKKIDSTLRGNIGVELDAVYDTFQPDFILVAPAYPQNKRNVINGCLLLDQTPLHSTEFAKDPKTPITDSFIPNLIEKDSKYKVGLMTVEDLKNGIESKLEEYYTKNIPYILFDSSSEEDLEVIAELLGKTKYNFIWAGSAGLATQLVKKIQCNKNPQVTIGVPLEPVLLVVGSVNKKNKKQLELLLTQPGIKGIRLNSPRFLIDEKSKQEEINRILVEANRAFTNNCHVVLFTSSEEDEIKAANYYGNLNGKSSTMVSDCISEVIGSITAHLVDKFGIQRLFLTGGDTAKKACVSIGINRFDLIDEIETGLPLGVFIGNNNKKIYAITKAGGFGSDMALLHSLEALKNVGSTKLCTI